MIDKLDNANVLMLSDRGDYGVIEVLGGGSPDIKVCYLAICRYSNDDAIYLFSCTDDLSVEGDSLFDNVEEAISSAQQRSDIQIVWNYPSDNK